MSLEEYRKLEELERKMLAREYEIKAVQFREKGDKSGNMVDEGEYYGATSILSNFGYSTLLEAYATITGLKGDAAKSVSDSLRHLDEISKYRHTSESGYSKSDTSSKQSSQALEDLNKKGEVFIPGPAGGHHHILKYTKEGDKYYRTEYNAGFGNSSFADLEAAEYTLTDGSIAKTPAVFSVIRIEIKDPHELGKALEFDFTLQNDLPKNVPFPEEYIAKVETDEKHRVTSQKIGNCNTRSTREMLRDHLPTSNFREMYDFVTEVSYEDMLTQVRAKREEMAKSLGIEFKTIEHNHYTELKDFTRQTILHSLGLPKGTNIPEYGLNLLYKKLEEIGDFNNIVVRTNIESAIKTLVSSGIIAKGENGNVDMSRISEVANTELLESTRREGHTLLSRAALLESEVFIDSLYDALDANPSLDALLEDDMNQTFDLLKTIIAGIADQSDKILTTTTIPEITRRLVDELDLRIPEIESSGSLNTYMQQNLTDLTETIAYDFSAEKKEAKDISEGRDPQFKLPRNTKQLFRQFVAENPERAKIMNNILEKVAGEKDVLKCEYGNITNALFSKFVSPFVYYEKLQDNIPAPDEKEKEYMHENYIPEIQEMIVQDKSLPDDVRKYAAKNRIQGLSRDAGTGRIHFVMKLDQMESMLSNDALAVYEQDKTAVKFFSKIRDPELIDKLAYEFLNQNESKTISELVSSNQDLDKEVQKSTISTPKFSAKKTLGNRKNWSESAEQKDTTKPRIL